MKVRVGALVLGATIVGGGVALGVLLAREEGRAAARRFLDQYGTQVGQKVTPAAQTFAAQAAKVGSQVAQRATEQGQAQLPKVREALSGVIAQAPQTAGALVGTFSRNGNQANPIGTSDDATTD